MILELSDQDNVALEEISKILERHPDLKLIEMVVEPTLIFNHLIIYTYTYTNLKSNGIYIIVAVKNQANQIEGFIRTTLFRIIYGKEENIKNIIAVDLNSTDETKQILEKLSNEYENIKVANWKECKDLFDNIDDTKL